tara:strand:- start:12015 stop:12887 length:873 start_codon:yes stop_codon:yes gene_type:complete
MKFKVLYLSAAVLLLGSSVTMAQVSKFKAVFIEAKENGQEVFVTLTNGNTFSGFVEAVDDLSAGVKTKDGVFNFKYDRIKSVELVDDNDPTTRWYKNPAANKLFITQSGRMSEAGSGYYQNTYIFISTLSYGVTKNITLSSNFSMVPGLDFSEQLLSGSVKIGTNVSENLSVSGTASYFSGFDADIGFSTIFGATTYSWNRLDLTAGLGLGITEDGASDLMTIIGAQFRVSEKFALLSENFVFPSGEGDLIPIGVLGGRFIGQTIAADLGFIVGDGVGAMVPFVSFTVKF